MRIFQLPRAYQCGGPALGESADRSVLGAPADRSVPCAVPATWTPASSLASQCQPGQQHCQPGQCQLDDPRQQRLPGRPQPGHCQPGESQPGRCKATETRRMILLPFHLVLYLRARCCCPLCGRSVMSRRRLLLTVLSGVDCLVLVPSARGT